MKTVLTIAGSDSSGGAGIQADIKTITMHGCYAMSAVTAITAQNTVGVRAVQVISPDILKDQIDAVFEDIPPDAVKIGMVSTSEQAEVIAGCLKVHRARNIVLDPVMVATSGAELSGAKTMQTMQTLLFPMAAVITPNIPEAEVLSGIGIETNSDLCSAACKLHDMYRTAVLIKGGHHIRKQNNANDLLWIEEHGKWICDSRVDNPNTHGTGCTLSSAIACCLAMGDTLEDAVRHAKRYLHGALAAGLDLGHGSGPLYHNFELKG